MKLWHLSLLTIVIAGIVFGTLMSRDPGYVLISYDGMSLQTSFWMMLLILALASATVYFVLRVTNSFLSTSERYKRWKLTSRKDKFTELTMKGLMRLQEGNFAQAQQDLIAGAKQGGSADKGIVNYLAAARAADAMGDGKKREQFLRTAQEKAEGAGNAGGSGYADATAGARATGEKVQAIQIAKAEMACARGDYQTCIDSLEGCASNKTSVLLLQKAYVATGNWDALAELLPDLTIALKKVLKDDAWITSLQKQIILGKLSTPSFNTEAFKSDYKKLPKVVRKDKQVVMPYTRFLLAIDEEQEAESLLRNSLKEQWCDDLVKIYGELGPGTLPIRLKHANNWLKRHEHNASLLNCLGRLYQQTGNIAEARRYFEKSLSIEITREASEQLGMIFAEEGNLIESNRYLKQAIVRKGST